MSCGDRVTGPLRWAPGLTLFLMLGPLAAGFLYTLAPALGWLPALGRAELGVGPFAELWAWPGSVAGRDAERDHGLGATLGSLVLVVVICAGWHDTPVFRGIERLLSPLLSVPHAAAAFGLAFLVSPSGWIARVLSPWATGWERPPDLLIVQDPAGLTLVAGLVSKEVPFLLLMTLAALGQVESRRSRTVAQTLGYTPVSAWLKAVFPRVYPQIRLPVYAVLAYAMSVVDVAVILGPNTPPTLSVQIVRWMNDPDLALRFRAAAGAITQLGLVVAALGLWRAGELVVAALGRRWIERGRRGGGVAVTRGLGLVAVGSATGAISLGLAGLAVWSVAGLWRFPASLPMR